MSTEWNFWLYIMASKSRVLYVGMTNELVIRVLQHKMGEIEGFTKRYKVTRLVYFEHFRYVKNCIAREKQVKAWTRAKRVALIAASNPTWEDLAADWFNEDWSLNLESESLRSLQRTDWTRKNQQQIPRFARDDKSKSSSGEGRAKT